MLLITVDQLQGKKPIEYRHKLDGGLGYLLNNGAWYTNANYSHSSTFTSTGHATIATGADIQKHGIAANDWYDQVGKRSVYSVSDPDYGRSPANLTTETIGDVLIRESGGSSRVFSISLKDRGAIIPGGHDGKAYWYSWRSGEFVSSPYYFAELPAWVQQWNKKKSTHLYRTETWDLLKDPSSYSKFNEDDRPYERGVRIPERGVPFADEVVAFDQVFPHVLSGLTGTGYFHALKHTPYADIMTADFARTLLVEEMLGVGGGVDMLAISFSATDFIGHAFGPGSLEAEDNLYWLDQTLGDLLSFIDQKIGLAHTLIVLSSDHGVAPIPEVLLDRGIAAGYHKPAKDIPQINEELKMRFGTGENLLRDEFLPPSYYLDHEAAKRADLDIDVLANFVASMIESKPGIKLAIPRQKFLSDTLLTTQEQQRLAMAFHPDRSGDILVIQEKNWNLSSDGEAYAALHGSPYTYDTHVPVIFAGPGIKAERLDRPVQVKDIASTIAALLGIPAPKDNAGKILEEVLPANGS